VSSMIIRIAVEELKAGMFVESMECSWLNNPFWRRSLLIKTDEDIARLVASPVAFVSIDTRKGRGTTLIPYSERRLATRPFSSSSVKEAPAERRRGRPGRADETLEETLARAKQKVIALFQEARLGKTITIEAVAPLVDDIATTMQRDAAALIEGTRLKLNNDYTYLHSIAVCALMANFAIHLGLAEDEVRAIGAAGLLHDIGKATTPEHILNKPGRLEGEELKIMRQHPAAGHAILDELGKTAAITLDVCLHHHERVDGSGYPKGLAGDAISLHSRIAAICDVYDAVTSIRPYKRPWSPHKALAQMLTWNGHFDPVLLDAFIANLGIQPLGALVRLHSNRLGIVLDGGEDPTQPLVRTFFYVPDAKFVGPEDVDTTHDPVLRGERGDYWFSERWAEVSADVLANRMLR
jgi:putative nucleotidyltransferase with HDIG domain